MVFLGLRRTRGVDCLMLTRGRGRNRGMQLNPENVSHQNRRTSFVAPAKAGAQCFACLDAGLRRHGEIRCVGCVPSKRQPPEPPAFIRRLGVGRGPCCASLDAGLRRYDEVSSGSCEGSERQPPAAAGLDETKIAGRALDTAGGNTEAGRRQRRNAGCAGGCTTAGDRWWCGIGIRERWSRRAHEGDAGQGLLQPCRQRTQCGARGVLIHSAPEDQSCKLVDVAGGESTGDGLAQRFRRSGTHRAESGALGRRIRPRRRRGCSAWLAGKDRLAVRADASVDRLGVLRVRERCTGEQREQAQDFRQQTHRPSLAVAGRGAGLDPMSGRHTTAAG